MEARAASVKQRAHPRSRGENAAEETAVDIHLGSSPLTRGKLPKKVLQTAEMRLIPAHAGKTPLRRHYHHQEGAHPRSRGENHSRSKPQRSHKGSSPLTRGKREAVILERGIGRLIPAHAGKTIDQVFEAAHEGAHPRSRGENEHFNSLP